MPTLQLLSLPPTDDTVILQDLTQYTEYPAYPLLELVLPTKTSYNLSFKPQETNVLRAPDGSLFPDGIYQAKYGVVPYTDTTICYSFLRTYQTDCRLAKWIAGIDWIQEPLDSVSYQLLAKYSALSIAASSMVQLGDLEKASSYLSVLQQLLPYE